MGSGGSFPGKKDRPGSNSDCSPPSSDEVEEWELYLLSLQAPPMARSGTTCFLLDYTYLVLSTLLCSVYPQVQVMHIFRGTLTLWDVFIDVFVTLEIKDGFEPVICQIIDKINRVQWLCVILHVVWNITMVFIFVRRMRVRSSLCGKGGLYRATVIWTVLIHTIALLLGLDTHTTVRLSDDSRYFFHVITFHFQLF
jgi:hypothetical protein